MEKLQLPIPKLQQRGSVRNSVLNTPKKKDSIIVTDSSNRNQGKKRRKSTVFSNFKVLLKNGKNKKKGKLNKNTNESISSTERERREKEKLLYSVNLLYIPKHVILETEQKRGKFKSFDGMEGRKEFLERSVQKFEPNSLKGLCDKLKHNSKTQKSYIDFYKKKHQRAISEAISDIKTWEQRQSKMPRVKIIKSGRLDEGGSLPVINIPLKYTKTGKALMMSDEERKKKVRTYKFAWNGLNKDFPIESREGASFSYCDGFGWLVGGINHQIIKCIWKFDLNETGDFRNNFEKVEIKNSELNMPRFNHSAVSYNKRIYFFGGERFASSNFYSRVCLNDVKILDVGKIIYLKQ